MDDPGRPAPSGRDEVERLFEAAWKLPRGDRAAYVKEMAAGSPGLAEEVLSLLEHADAGDRFFQGLERRIRAGIDDAGEEGGGAGESRPVERPLLPGTAVGRYRILEKIASGGMGTVYRAHDPTLHRDVALKLLSPDLVLDPEARERFFLEARAAAALDHPHVCTVHEVGESEEGRPFLAMALYQGETLKARLSRGPLPVEEAVAVALAVARGLAAAHAQGIVHRDVKPGNVMLTPGGGVKLLDFGVAQMAAVSWPGTGLVAGTPAYMSPQQIRGEPVDARADLWALGVVLHEMLTGVRPFQGNDDRALLHAILHEEPDSLESLRPEAPASVARVVSRLLRKAADERFPSAEEAAAELEAALALGGAPGKRGERAAPSVPGRGPVSSRVLALGTAVALVLATATAILWRNSGGEVVPLRVAVLPFLAVGDESTSPPLSDGMTDAVRELLGRTEGVRILGGASAAAFGNRPADLRHLADSLQVDFVVGGSVQRSGSGLGVRVWILDGEAGSVRWSRAFDREMVEVFQVQEEIARAVSTELGGRSEGPRATARARPPTGSLAAYELYLRASDRTVLRNDSTAREALEDIRRAVALDSSYAAAWSTLARLTMRVELLSDSGVSTSAEEVLARAEDAALRATSLDASLAEAYYVLGAIRMAEGDFIAAEDHLTRASALDPSWTLALEALVRLHLWAGRPGPAVAVAQRALELDPLSPAAHAELAHALAADGRCPESLVRLERIATLDPPLLRAGPIAAQCHALAGRWSEALAALDRPGAEGDPFAMAHRAHVLARSGRRDEALRLLDTLLESWRNGGRVAFPVAIVHAGLGDPDETFRWLHRAMDDGPLPIVPGTSIMDPLFQELHPDPRFEELRARLGSQNR